MFRPFLNSLMTAKLIQIGELEMLRATVLNRKKAKTFQFYTGLEPPVVHYCPSLSTHGQ